MSRDHVFISHSSKDDDFVKELREALESLGVEIWADSRELTGGDKLTAEIESNIENARQFIVVVSFNALNSAWVQNEVRKALEVERRRKSEGYKVIPLMLPGIQPPALKLLFGEEPVGLRVELKTGGVSEALPAILAALGERLPADFQPIKETVQQPVEELILKLTNTEIHEEGGKRRARATATLIYEPADNSARAVESKRFIFTAPLGVIEADDLRWYLEEYFVWPVGMFKERAERIEAQLPHWGRDLYKDALAPQVAGEALTAWQQAGADGERRFSVFVDSELPEGATQEEQTAAREAATELLSMPWELLHDGRGFLFHGKNPVRVRRRLPNYHSQPVRPTQLPIRILLATPRPEDERTRYIDHRISAKPLVEALESLGELAELSVLTPPTFKALEETLQKAADAGEPFDVVHFDGHGVYDHKVGLGGLCFEDPNDTEKLEKRAMQLIYAEKLAEVIRDYRIPLVFLEACQSAKTEKNPTASVAAKLLEEGVTSVVAMSHSVLVETAHRFVKAFYQELAQGKRVGTAMIAGQRELHRDSYRGKMMGAGKLHLQDWFVPVLYQEEQDPQLMTELPPKEVQQLQARQRRLSLGELPDPPSHEFIGRSRELLALERLLHSEPYAVVRGQGGAGKTTLAVELARWLVRTGRFRRAAFVSLEEYTDARTLLDSLGRQLLPEGGNWSVAQFVNLKHALQPVERALADRATIIVLDNLESVLPDQTGQYPPGAAPIDELFDLCQKLLNADPATRILFTSREPMATPFDNKRFQRGLEPLDPDDAMKLVSHVMAQEGLIPNRDDPGDKEEAIRELVEAVNCHARALVKLAPELARRGVRATTDNLHQLMDELHRKYPDDPENSLYASVELSLRRLTPESREQIGPLGAFHGGANLMVLYYVLGVDEQTARKIGGALIEVGLAEQMAYDHLRLDPALPPFLRREMSEPKLQEARSRWAEAMGQLTDFLYQQRSQNAWLAAQLTLLELPNLMALLLWSQDTGLPEDVVDLASRIETLLALLGRPQALAHATRVRERAARGLGKWSHARFIAEHANVDRLLEGGDLQMAYTAAQQLLQRGLAAGEGAYPDTAYDLALAHLMVGRVLKKEGKAEAALPPLAEAQRRFDVLGESRDMDAGAMASVAITDSGDCLRVLGRLDKATAAYQESLSRAEKRDDWRQIATNKSQLGAVRLLQGRYTEALKIYDEARAIFESLREPRSVATAWHNIGIAHREAGQFELAELADRKSLAISVQQKDRNGEAGNLAELGNLCVAMGRWEDAVKCYQQAADLYVKLPHQRYEGSTRSNLASALIELQRYDEARRELLRAIECDKPYSHAAEPWTTWKILYNLEQATDHLEAAAQARQQAIESYLAYRRADGQSMQRGAQLCALAVDAIAQKDTTELEGRLARLSGAETTPASIKLLIPKLQAILCGDRDPALAADLNLDYDDAAELQLLLEALNSKKKAD